MLVDISIDQCLKSFDSLKRKYMPPISTRADRYANEEQEIFQMTGIREVLSFVNNICVSNKFSKFLKKTTFTHLLRYKLSSIGIKSFEGYVAVMKTLR